MGFKKFLENIQNSDETTKKRWLIGMTAVSMIIIVSLWLIYMKSTLGIVSRPENQETSVGFWQIFKNGLSIVSNSIKENVKLIGQIL